MYKAYKFRIYPNEQQKVLLNKSFGCARFVYNHYLSLSIKDGYKSKNIYIKDYVNNLKSEYPFLTEIDSIVIRQSIFNLDNAYQNFFKTKHGYPKFKNKYAKNSYTTSAVYRNYKDKKYCNIELDLIKNQIKLPKIKWIKVRGYRNLDAINGRIISATISRESNGKYYVSLLYELPELKSKKKSNESIVGIDLGIKKLITLSDGTTYENNKYILKYEKRIKRLQRELSRKVKSSKNYYKCKQKLAIIYSKLKNARSYYLHKITKQITDNYDIVVTERLQTKNMLQNKNLSKKIIDASFHEIIRQLQYKTKWKGKEFYQIDTYYPSSQTCSVCESIDKKYRNLDERIYKCCSCHNELDRDLNASINIMFEGLKLHIKYNFS